MQNSQIFIISTVGQARNAKALIEQINIAEKCLVVILWTKSNTAIPSRAEEIFSDVPVKIQWQRLPTAPHFITLGKLAYFGRMYAKLLQTEAPEAVWIANSNRHYAIMAEIAKDKGISVNYFEEGLGTYKTRDYILDKNAAAPLAEKLKRLRTIASRYSRTTLLGAVPRILFNEVQGLWRLSSDIVATFSNIFASSPNLRRRFRVFLPKRTDAYFDVNTFYDKVRVVFPERLATDLFQTDDLKTYSIDVDQEDRDEAASILNALEGDLPTTIYISQNYGGKSSKYYGAVARCLAELQIKSLAIKFHPKEHEESRGYLLAALEANNIHVFDLHALNDFPAETLLATNVFTDVIGITSSTLLYSSTNPAIKKQISIAPALIKKLKRSGFKPEPLSTLQMDADLLVDVLENRSYD